MEDLVAMINSNAFPAFLTGTLLTIAGVAVDFNRKSINSLNEQDRPSGLNWISGPGIIVLIATLVIKAL